MPETLKLLRQHGRVEPGMDRVAGPGMGDG